MPPCAWPCWAAAWSDRRWPASCSSRPTTCAPASGARSSWSASASADDRRAPGHRPGAVHDRPGRPGRARRRRPGHRADRRHQPGTRTAARGDPGRQVGRHRQQGAAGPARRRDLRRRGRRRRRRLLRGGRRGRHPDHPAAARVAGRRRGHRRQGHRQRHHQLHPRPDAHPRPSFSDALAEAQRLGYAEADPTADVEGHDAAAKAAILASLAFHTRVTLDDVACEGISSVTADDVAGRRVDALRHQAAGPVLGLPGRDGRRGRPPDDGAAGAPARRHPRRLQRRVHRVGQRRAPHVHGTGRRRVAHGVRRARRRGHRRPQPCPRRGRPRRVRLHHAGHHRPRARSCRATTWR